MIYDVLKEDMHSDDDAGYSHSDPPEETMPYTSDEKFDSWAGDIRPMSESTIVDPNTLPQWLTDLRDGIETPPSQAGLARQQRLAQMERDISACKDVVTDCDRYAEYMERLESPCVYDVVPKMMGQALRDLKGRALHKHRRLTAELAILRRQG